MAQTKQQKSNQFDRLEDYCAIYESLDGRFSDETAFRLSRMQDALAKTIRKHDPQGRTVGRILGWDKVGKTHGN
jgi:hypothetical protein